MSAVNNDPQFNRLVTDGKESNLHRVISAPQAPDHLDDENSLFLPSASVNYRPYFPNEHRDVEPESAVRFGGQATFRIGNEGYGALARMELHVKLPVIGDSAGGVANPHPLDVGYAGAGTFIDWQPYIGELLNGGLEGQVRIQQGTEVLRTYDCEGIHVKRRLCMDNEGSNKRAAYENGVGRLSASTQSELWLVIPVWSQWGTDDTNYNQMFPTQAFGVPTTIKIDIPRLGQLVQTDVAASNLRVVENGSYDTQGNLSTMFMRLHFVVTNTAERVAFANLTLREGGLSYKVMHSVKEAKFLTTTTTAHTVKVPIERSQNPCAFLVAYVRALDDTKAVGETSEADDARIQPRSSGGVIQRPDAFRYLPISAYYLEDSGKRITPVWSPGTWNSSQMGHVNYFPSTPVDEWACIVFTISPTLENHGMGHTNFSASHKPQLVLELPAIDAAVEGAISTREVTLITYERNTWSGESGQQALDYAGTA